MQYFVQSLVMNHLSFVMKVSVSGVCKIDVPRYPFPLA
jgi:hypothetical protein